MKTKTEHIGNKAKNLMLLQSIGVSVPPFSIIPFERLKSLLELHQLPYDQKSIESLVIPDQWVNEIIENHPDCKIFAVRSSSGVEDSHDKSYAGQFLTLLNVDVMGLQSAIKKVWLSVFAQHINAYNSQGTEQIPISVIVQECIEADASGVIFTVDPTNESSDCSVVNAVYGMGEGLVSGQLDADMYHIKNNEIVSKHIVSKYEKLIYSGNNGLKMSPLDEGISNVQVLSDDNCLKLYKAAKVIENYFKQAQDIEFCFKDNELFILQCRPITTINSNKPYLIWDNSNIIESYPGITLPLTYSFISKVYSDVYKQLCAVLGVSKSAIEDNFYTFDNMLGLLKGRVYYNLYSWYKLLSLLPGYSLNAGFMEKMMGVSEKFELKDYKKPSGLKEYINIFRLASNMLYNAFTLPKMRRKFREKFYSVLNDFNASNIEKADAITCMHAYLNFEKTLSKEWKAPLVNDFFAMIYYGVFQKFISKNHRYFPLGHNHYLSYTGKVITVEPSILQQQMIETINSQSELKELFIEDETTIYYWISSHPENTFSKQFNSYILKWGDRCFAELKLETTTYRINPLLFIGILKKTFNQKVQLNNSNTSQNFKDKLPWTKRIVFNFLKSKAIDTVSERENLRYERTRAFAAVRQIFIRIGVLMHEADVIEHPRDIFYLGKDEIFNYIRGSALQVNLKSCIELRKKEFLNFMSEPEQAPRIRTEGIVYTNYFGSSANPTESDLKGIPCSKGIVKAQVKIVHSPNDIEGLEGKIMLTISTDPGWVSVFPLLAGIIVERGSVLSHAAIVSREMDIPCIVGVKHITTTLKDDQWIEMDGTTGTIRIIE